VKVLSGPEPEGARVRRLVRDALDYRLGRV